VKPVSSLQGWCGAIIFFAASVISGPAVSQQSGPLKVEAVYTADAVSTASGGGRGGAALDNLDLLADLDLEKAAGWAGFTVHAHLLSNNGGQPNDDAGSLQGVNNIEVARQGLRLYEFWLEAPLGAGATVRAGLYDLNSEFYANDSAGLLINPTFGIGSELAATGPNGPSIFPSTALGLRVNFQTEGGYLRAAVLNAHAGVPGDPGGIRFDADDGLLTIGEVGLVGDNRLSLGAWRYTEDQDDIRDLSPKGGAARRTAEGVYLTAEWRLSGHGEEGGPVVTGFTRAGISDGDTSLFKGGWQAGLLVKRPIAARPDSAFSIGIQQGYLSPKLRANMKDAGGRPARAETGFEITYSDRLNDRVTLQPDLQVILDAGGDADADAVVLLGIRLTVDLF
jgi:porin